MKSEITDIIADLVLDGTPDLQSRFEYQSEALSEVACTNPVLGRWIDENDVKYLLASLGLSDKDFAKRFPSIANVSGHQRQRIVAAIETHLEYCQHCSLKTGYDFELDERIKQTCQENHGFLLQRLEEEEETDLSDEGDHENISLKNVLWANS